MSGWRGHLFLYISFSVYEALCSQSAFIHSRCPFLIFYQKVTWRLVVTLSFLSCVPYTDTGSSRFGLQNPYLFSTFLIFLSLCFTSWDILSTFPSNPIKFFLHVLMSKSFCCHPLNICFVQYLVHVSWLQCHLSGFNDNFFWSFLFLVVSPLSFCFSVLISVSYLYITPLVNLPSWTLGIYPLERLTYKVSG